MVTFVLIVTVMIMLQSHACHIWNSMLEATTRISTTGRPALSSPQQITAKQQGHVRRTLLLLEK
jgi:hypothetical protein